MAQPQLDLDRFRTRLEEMRASTQSEIDGLQDEVTSDNEDTNYGVKNHPAEDASNLFNRERSLAIGATMERELAQIDRALQHIADGSYGICEIGGEPIPVERLEARPAATLCIQHQREQDDQARDVPDPQI
jgi:RNA polymerase-binding protein DksA